MTAYLVFYESSGAIVNYLQCPDAAVAIQQEPSGGGILPLSLPPSNPSGFIANNYVSNGAIVACATMNLTVSGTSFVANGTASVTISGIPSESLVTISGAVTAGPETITDGELVITSTETGSILVSITNSPAFMPWSTTLNAT